EMAGENFAPLLRARRAARISARSLCAYLQPCARNGPADVVHRTGTMLSISERGRRDDLNEHRSDAELQRQVCILAIHPFLGEPSGRQKRVSSDDEGRCAPPAPFTGRRKIVDEFGRPAFASGNSIEIALLGKPLRLARDE